MVLDTSAVIAILRNEPDADRYRRAIEEADELRIGAPTLVECEIVARAALGEEGALDLRAFICLLDVRVEPFGPREAEYASLAYRRYGKGRHDGGLNLGDCFSYAIAASHDEPLLFKGDDFSRTDIASALAAP
jgi:ribonuclease VapC